MRPPGLKKFRLRCMKRLSRPILETVRQFFSARRYCRKISRSLIFPAKGGLVIKMSKSKYLNSRWFSSSSAGSSENLVRRERKADFPSSLHLGGLRLFNSYTFDFPSPAIRFNALAILTAFGLESIA